MKVDLSSYFTKALSTRFAFAAIILGSLDLLPSAHAVANCTPVSSGLVSWWAAENTANDGAEGNNGVLRGGATFAPGKVGTAFSLNGSNAFVSITASSNLNVGLGGGLTVECWIKPDDVSRQQVIVEWNNGIGGVGVQLFHSIPQYGGVGSVFANLLDTSGNDHYFASSPNMLNASNFQHVAVTYDKASGMAKIFYNGLAVASQNLGTFVPQTSFPLYLGTRASGNGAGSFFKGLLDETTLYNRALSDSEILAIYNAGTSGKCAVNPPPTCTPLASGLISWWRGENNAFDSVDGNSGVLVGNATYGVGRVATGFEFDGDRDAVVVSNAPNLQVQNLTIETWIKRNSASRISFGADGGGFLFGYVNGGYVFYLGGNAHLYFGKAGTVAYPSAGTITDTNYHHVAVTKSGSTVTFYIDGVSNSVVTLSQTFTFTSPVGIGGEGDDADSSFLGRIDELAVYNRALSASEIQGIFNANLTGRCQEPPVVVTHPASQRVTVGSNVTFTATAVGTPQLRYQWIHGGEIAGATGSTLSFTVQPNSGGNYFVRVTNAFGSTESSNAVLTVNNIPTALAQSVALDEDASIAITLQGNDVDNDILSFSVVTPPTHGSLTGTGDSRTYTPTANYSGPDNFTFKVNDGLVDSAVATVSINVRPINDPPVAYSQSVTLDEDSTVNIALGTFDADGDLLSFIVGSPAHGTLTGTPPNLVYHPAANYNGPDNFTFSVNDGLASSATANVSITVQAVNDAPVVRITIAPLTVLPDDTNLLVLAPVCSHIDVTLNGSQSSDVEGDPLQFLWLEGTNILGNDTVVTNSFDPGIHEIMLVVNDGQTNGTNTVRFEVLKPEEAVTWLAVLVSESDLGGRNAQPFLAVLKSATASFERCNAKAGINQLEAFQKQVRAQISPSNPALASKLTMAAQAIIQAAQGLWPTTELEQAKSRFAPFQSNPGK